MVYMKLRFLRYSLYIHSTFTMDMSDQVLPPHTFDIPPPLFADDSSDFTCPSPPVELEEPPPLLLQHAVYYFEDGTVTFLVSVPFSCHRTAGE
jgi:hypothetical protein